MRTLRGEVRTPPGVVTLAVRRAVGASSSRRTVMAWRMKRCQGARSTLLA